MRAEIKIAYSDATLVVSLRDKVLGDEFQECFRIDQHIDMTFEKYFFVSAHSGMALSNYHYLYSIATVDLDTRLDKS